MQFSYIKYDESRWRPWFAWHPVKIVTYYPDSSDTKITWVWLRKVERVNKLLGWKYRLDPLDNNN